MEQLIKAEDYTVLFVISARNFEDFLINASLNGEIDNSFHYVMDPGLLYLTENGQIPPWLIMDQAITINKHNRIKMVGEPFANADMTKVFHIVTGVDTHHPVESK